MVRAQEDELSAIALGLQDAGHGQIEYVSDWDQPDPATEFAMLRRVVELVGCSCVFTNNQRHGKRNWVWRELLELSDRAAAAGLRMRPIAAPRPIRSLFGLTGTQNPFSATPTYRSIAHLPLEQRVATMQREEVRRCILAQDPYAASRFPLFHLMGFERMFEHMFLLTDPPDYAPPKERSIASSAGREGRPASEVAYDMPLSGGGRNFLWAAFTGYDSFTLDSVDEMLDHPNAMIGLETPEPMSASTASQRASARAGSSAGPGKHLRVSDFWDATARAWNFKSPVLDFESCRIHKRFRK